MESRVKKRYEKQAKISFPDHFDFESLTIPGRAFDIGEALRRHRLGFPVVGGSDKLQPGYDIEGEENENDIDECFDSHMSFIKDEMDAIDFVRDAQIKVGQAQTALQAIVMQDNKLNQDVEPKID